MIPALVLSGKLDGIPVFCLKTFPGIFRFIWRNKTTGPLHELWQRTEWIREVYPFFLHFERAIKAR
jgi:hypothetical protein